MVTEAQHLLEETRRITTPEQVLQKLSEWEAWERYHRPTEASPSKMLDFFLPLFRAQNEMIRVIAEVAKDLRSKEYVL